MISPSANEISIFDSMNLIKSASLHRHTKLTNYLAIVFFHLNRSTISICFCFIACCFLNNVVAAQDPLPTWHDGPIKQNIFAFVNAITHPASKHFVPIEDRIAVFDNDGTLWVEKPYYTQTSFIIDRIKQIANQHPDWLKKKPYRTAIRNKQKEIEDLTMREFTELLIASQTGLTIEAYQAILKKWLATAKNTHFNRHYTSLTYQPMQELIAYLRQNHFQIYLVTGAGQEFARAFAKDLYGIPNDHVIGTVTNSIYSFKNNQPALTLGANLILTNEKIGKPQAIHLVIGKKPILAVGNSIGDQQMFEWTESTPQKHLILIVQHDDEKREFDYGMHSPIGTLNEALLEEAKKFHWQVISMKKDWKKIFAFEKANQ